MRRLGAVLLLALIAGAITLTTAGCATESRRVLPPAIRTVHVEELGNETPEPVLAGELREELRRAFRLDGRLAVAEEREGADAVLGGVISAYVRQPARYDANHVVQEYRLRLAAGLTLTGTAGEGSLWTGGAAPRTVAEEGRYVVVPAAGLPVESEADAARRLLRELAATAVRRVLEGW